MGGKARNLRKRTGKAVVADPRQMIESGFQAGETSDCDRCGGVMALQRGLTHLGRSRFGLVVVTNLEGFKCRDCGRESWTPPSYDAIQQAISKEPPGFGAKAKVSRLARNNLGAYFPKDLQEHMGLHAGDRLVMQPLDGRFLLVEIEHQDEKAKKGRPAPE